MQRRNYITSMSVITLMSYICLQYSSVHSIKIDVISYRHFMNAYSMYNNAVGCDDSMDSQLDLGSPCISDSKMGLHLRITMIFICHFCLKE